MTGDGDRDDDGLPGGESVGAGVAGPGDAGETGPVTGEAKPGDAGRSSSRRWNTIGSTGDDMEWPLNGRCGGGTARMNPPRSSTVRR